MYKPVYRYPRRIAKEENELEEYRESRKENIACKDDIEEAIRKGFDGCHLNGDCARELCEKHGTERVGWVLANTVQHYTWDGRYRPHNQEWADRFPIPTDAEDMTTDYCVSSHPEIVNGLIDQYRAYVQSTDLLDSSACLYDSRGGNFEDKLMILSPSALREKYRSSEYQYFIAQSGFGCKPDTLGGKVFGRFLADGEEGQFRRSHFLGEADNYGLPDWARKKLQELTIICEDGSDMEMGGMT